MITLEQAKRVILHARAVETDMPLGQLLCILVLAGDEEGMSLTELAKKANLQMATASRYIGSLGKIDRHREEGLNLVESFENPMERRKKIVRLTPKGKNLVSRMLGE